MIIFKIVYNIDLKVYINDNVFIKINKLNFNWAEDVENKEKKQIYKTA